MNDILEFIKSNTDSLRSAPEESIKTSIILRILQNLGWNIFDHNELKAEFSNGKGRVDYALYDKLQLKILIEAKKASENLENHEEQLLKYSFEVGVELSILTNGFTWWFYLPLEKGHWKERKFLTIDILNQKFEIITDRFHQFLSKDNITNGSSLRLAKESYSNKKINDSIIHELPLIWEDMLKNGNKILSELIADEIEKKLGYTVDKSIIVNFLKEEYRKNAYSISTITEIEKPKKIIKNTMPNSKNIYRLNHDEGVAVLEVIDRNFILKRGSQIKRQYSEAFPRTNPKAFELRKKLYREKKIIDNTTQEDIVFTSSSPAASFVLGCSSSGPREFNIT